MNKVKFEEDEEASIPIPVAQPVTIVDMFFRSGIVSTRGNALMLLAIAAFLLITVSMFLIASAMPPPPVLGSDVLNYGETVPDYVK